MKQKAVIVEINAQGLASIDLEGFQGKGCHEVAEAFRGSDKLISSKTKREYAIEPAQKARVKQ